MRRPLHIWMVFLACLGLLLAGMGWVTWNTLALEKAREKAAQEADVQESVRLALWRLDFQASALMIRENARPPRDFRAFYAQEGVVGKDNDLFKKGDVMAASPLLAEPPEQVLLHFQMDAGGVVRSPQVPQNSEREVALALFVDEDAVKRSEERLQTLRTLLTKPASMLLPDSDGDAMRRGGKAASVTTNRELLRSMACFQPAELSNEAVAKLMVAQNDSTLSRNNNWAVQQGVTSTPQSYFNSVENAMRSRAVNQQSEEAMKQQVVVKAKEPEPKPAEKPVTRIASTPVKKAAADKLEATRQEPAKTDALVALKAISAATAAPAASSMPLAAPAPVAGAPGQPTPSAPPRTATESKPFQGVWIEGNLILAREAWVDGARTVQGVWLDWPALRAAWMREITDLFPAATLEPAANASPGSRPVDDPLRFAALPLRLVTGTIALAELPFWTPLRKSLAVAVGCVALAALAVGLLLYGTVALSERRAAFVSAVTHELRTPLTTFRLYSEMLADDMVQDAAQRKTYLDTLSGEAGRLSHLVENVLAYARLERGSAKARAEHVTIGSLLDRILPRLQQRASDCGMEVRVHANDEDRKTSLHIDAAAVEQILFNLVDNACKYAAPRAAQPVIHVEADTSGRFAMLRVRDHGQGISRGERGRIFRPFHKSADQAAHSAPGVGLGLALCRRLATALGGAITLDAGCKDGACFVVRLPVR
ncbi:MAG: HAMP domain-containing histidine kinase [Verrucomicrobiaceae bacterium]|nr:HAMP domain-containing histidine kinase [Verrucomicrobiaceae bacterium]